MTLLRNQSTSWKSSRASFLEFLEIVIHLHPCHLQPWACFTCSVLSKYQAFLGYPGTEIFSLSNEREAKRLVKRRNASKRLLIGSVCSKDLTCAPRGSLVFLLFASRSFVSGKTSGFQGTFWGSL